MSQLLTGVDTLMKEQVRDIGAWSWVWSCCYSLLGYINNVVIN